MHNVRITMWLFLFLPLMLIPALMLGWGTNNRTDPFPLYTALDPHTFNTTRHRQIIHGRPIDKAPPEWVTLSLTAFGQAADSTRVPCGGSVGPSPTLEPTCVDIPLGDIDGRWDMIALLYGRLPRDQTLGPILTEAFQALFPELQPGQIDDDLAFDIDQVFYRRSSNQTFGFFSNALKYRKYGVRWDFEAQLICDFGFQFQGGLADITQTLTRRLDLTDSCTFLELDDCNPTIITGKQVKRFLMDKVNDIGRELCLDVCSFHEISLEDLYFCLYWRHAHEINFTRDPSWARFLVIPFIRIAGSAPSGRTKDQAVMFSVPFGNNGHPSINANAGINIDFTETIEIGGEVGYSHFFARDICGMHIPTSTYQTGIFPFKATVNVQPGDTWYAAGKLSAYHFIDRLNFWAQWVLVKHKPDTIRLLDCDPAFITAKCPTSEWYVQFINAAFTYDCSPNISLGAAWQFPIKWERAYKSNTVLFSFIASF